MLDGLPVGGEDDPQVTHGWLTAPFNYCIVPLFDRRHRSVRVNRGGRAYLKEVQRILAEVHGGVSERQRRWPRRVRIVSVEAVAEKWLVPRLVTFKAEHPVRVAIELETNHRSVDPDGRDFATPGSPTPARPLRPGR